MKNLKTIILVATIVAFFTISMLLLGDNTTLAKQNEKLQAFNIAQANAVMALMPEKYIAVGNGETFKVTHYHANCQEGFCNTSNKTSTGTVPTPYWTVATDPQVIPPGSLIVVNNEIYLAEDSGVYGNVIDICVISHEEAIDLGRYYTDNVYILKEAKP